jgi:hypothetical protein
MNACSSGSSTPSRTEVNGGSGASSTNGAAVNAVNAANNTGSTGIIMTTSSDGAGGTAPRDLRCDENGQNCVCINIGMFGRLGTYGAVPGMDSNAALEAWLDANSSAAADTMLTKPTLTAEFLANYDVIILQALESLEGAGQQWQFSADEIAAFEAWVRAGGGVISLMGYGAYPDEAGPTNALLAFTGLQYSGLTGPGDTADPDTCPNECCYCLGNSIATTGWDATHPISANITAVGAFWGRSITMGANTQLVAKVGSKTFGATAQVDAGRVFAFHDEWVTYTSQWDGTGLEDDCRDITDPNHSCLDVHPSTEYQVPQFWYNSLRWASGDVACFDINNDDIIK